MVRVMVFNVRGLWLGGLMVLNVRGLLLGLG